mmetsp:Transcript_77453/g.250603  ORF Transcript_77453/g.250603 Transcript_77453/m.250603 type:complete len:212 (-) Transcript_77453:14-649(-)
MRRSPSCQRSRRPPSAPSHRKAPRSLVPGPKSSSSHCTSTQGCCDSNVRSSGGSAYSRPSRAELRGKERMRRSGRRSCAAMERRAGPMPGSREGNEVMPTISSGVRGAAGMSRTLPLLWPPGLGPASAELAAPAVTLVLAQAGLCRGQATRWHSCEQKRTARQREQVYGASATPHCVQGCASGVTAAATMPRLASPNPRKQCRHRPTQPRC